MFYTFPHFWKKCIVLVDLENKNSLKFCGVLQDQFTWESSLSLSLFRRTKSRLVYCCSSSNYLQYKNGDTSESFTWNCRLEAAEEVELFREFYLRSRTTECFVTWTTAQNKQVRWRGTRRDRKKLILGSLSCLKWEKARLKIKTRCVEDTTTCWMFMKSGRVMKSLNVKIRKWLWKTLEGGKGGWKLKIYKLNKAQGNINS